MLIAVNFHYVRHDFEAPYPAIHGVTPAEFAAQLDALARAFEFVGGPRLAAAARGEAALPDRACVVTFDDGLREQAEVAWPILQDKGIPAVFFVNTCPIFEGRPSLVHLIHLMRSRVPAAEVAEAAAAEIADRGLALPTDLEERAAQQYRYDTPDDRRVKYMLNMVLDEAGQAAVVRRVDPGAAAAAARAIYMDREHLRALGAAGAVGTHAHEHLPLARLPPADARRQVLRSTELLSDNGVRGVQGISYPFGSPSACSPEVARIAAEAGLSFGLTMERAVNRDLAAPMMLSRFAQNDVVGARRPAYPTASSLDAAPSAAWGRA